jgi:hypothetical protein
MFVVLGISIWAFSDNPSLEEWRKKAYWISSCVMDESGLIVGRVERLDDKANGAWVLSENGVSAHYKLGELLKSECSTHPSLNPAVIPIETKMLDSVADQQKEIQQLQHELSIMRLKLELARVTQEYYKVLLETPNDARVR